MDSKKEQIQTAAMQCFARYGVYKATMDDIAAALGMKKASLYYYYKNKEAIFVDALETEMQRVFTELEKQFTPGMTATEKLQMQIRFSSSYFRERAEMMEINIQAMVDNHALFVKVHQRLREQGNDFTARIIREGIANGEFRDCDVELVASSLRSTFDGMRFEFFRSAGTGLVKDVDFSKMENELLYILDLIINGLRKH
jgi:TetR/AcrR family transcriptional regulator